MDMPCNGHGVWRLRQETVEEVWILVQVILATIPPVPQFVVEGLGIAEGTTQLVGFGDVAEQPELEARV